jgi:hypothetical protein
LHGGPRSGPSSPEQKNFRRAGNEYRSRRVCLNEASEFEAGFTKARPARPDSRTIDVGPAVLMTLYSQLERSKLNAIR